MDLPKKATLHFVVAKDGIVVFEGENKYGITTRLIFDHNGGRPFTSSGPKTIEVGWSDF